MPHKFICKQNSLAQKWTELSMSAVPFPYSVASVKWLMSLSDTLINFVAYLLSYVLTKCLCVRNQKGQRVLIAAHGNSLRALVKYLDNMSDADIMALNIPTGIVTGFQTFL